MQHTPDWLALVLARQPAEPKLEASLTLDSCAYHVLTRNLREHAVLGAEHCRTRRCLMLSVWGPSCGHWL